MGYGILLECLLVHSYVQLSFEITPGYLKGWCSYEKNIVCQVSWVQLLSLKSTEQNIISGIIIYVFMGIDIKGRIIIIKRLNGKKTKAFLISYDNHCSIILAISLRLKRENPFIRSLCDSLFSYNWLELLSHPIDCTWDYLTCITGTDKSGKKPDVYP